MARIEPETLERHGHVRIDDYYWLRERSSPEVIDYLEQENAYLEAVAAPWAPLREELLTEILGRIEKDDASVPIQRDDYLYYTRYEGDAEYPLYCRRKSEDGAPEQIMLDGPALAQDQDFFQIGATGVSSDHKTLAYAIDTVGRRIYTLHFKDLDTGGVRATTIPRVTPNFTWAEDNETIFYTRQDPQTLRYFQTYRHVVGTDPDDDVLVYQEDDTEFETTVTRTASRDFILIQSEQTLASEVRFLPADHPDSSPVVFEPRREGHEYRVDHLGDHFFIRTNWQATNFRLMRAPDTDTSRTSWTEEIAHRDDVFLRNFALFDDYLVVEERRGGLIDLGIRPWSAAQTSRVDLGEVAYAAAIGANPDPATTVLRYHYSSMTTPPSVFDYDMATTERTLRKQTRVLGGFDAQNYVTERLDAEARDGTAVPISLVYRRDLRREGGNPLLLYGYGSYGASIDAGFSSDRLSLLDRGFVYAIAHVRGGQELGRAWYEGGKLTRKRNTFTDFIDSAEHLIEAGYGDAQRVFAMGGSAGGLLMGAVVNMRPDLWRGVVARVPFVDVVTTMLDESIPLTSSEWDEWGDPRRKADYDYMLSYSPYDQVEAREVPHLLVTAGLHDSQVQYWEPAKWVAKLRARKTNDHLLLLRTDMDAGHGGASGRFRAREETALIFAFLLTLSES